MDTASIYVDFLKSDFEKRLSTARDPTVAGVLRDYLGDAIWTEYRQLAGNPVSEHLAAGRPANVIFVPGVMGSLLFNETKGGIWWIDFRARDKIDLLRLAPGGEIDVDPADRISPVTSDLSYEPFLKAVLDSDDFHPAVFAYDWRKALRHSVDRLRDKVSELYAANEERPVHVVAHSMGGLIVRTALMTYGGELVNQLARIIFIGTPHYGSPAIAGYLKNHLHGFDLMGLLGRYLSRDTLRSLWGVISLLPAPCGVYPGTRESGSLSVGSATEYPHRCGNFDFYRASEWKLGLAPDQEAEFQRALNAAEAWSRDIHAAHEALPFELKERMLCIAGVGMKTLFRLEYRTGWPAIWHEMKKTTDRIPGDIHRDGDGRVPVASAILDDVETRYVVGEHGSLTNLPAVQEAVFAALRGEPSPLPITMIGALRDHLAAPPERSPTPHLDGSVRMRAVDDPGYLDFDEFSLAQLDALDAELAGGKLPEFERVKLL
jgi:pimeloyl-ACP methyl ester carboxylesterase